MKKAAPILKSVAKVAAPMVGTAIGGPFGAILGKLASSALGRRRTRRRVRLHELACMSSKARRAEGEFELEHEGEMEPKPKSLHEIVHHEVSQHEALAEMMAEAAAHEQHEGEAEAMAGAAAMTVISPADRRALRRISPPRARHGILTRILRRRRATRPAVRAVPTIIRRTVNTVKRQAAVGKPITRQDAWPAPPPRQVRRSWEARRLCTAAIAQNVRASRNMRGARVASRGIRG